MARDEGDVSRNGADRCKAFGRGECQEDESHDEEVRVHAARSMEAEYLILDSFFGTQEGNFSLTVNSIGAISQPSDVEKGFSYRPRGVVIGVRLSKLVLWVTTNLMAESGSLVVEELQPCWVGTHSRISLGYFYRILLGQGL